MPKTARFAYQRAWYIAHWYKAAVITFPCYRDTPIDFGKQLSVCRNFVEIDWFDGDQVPSEVANAADNDEEQDESNSDSDERESEDDHGFFKVILNHGFQKIPHAICIRFMLKTFAAFV